MKEIQSLPLVTSNLKASFLKDRFIIAYSHDSLSLCTKGRRDLGRHKVFRSSDLFLIWILSPLFNHFISLVLVLPSEKPKGGVLGTSLVVRWLRLQNPTVRGLGSIPCQEIRSYMQQLRRGALLWNWNENWPFPVLSFPNLLAYWVQHFHSIIF